MLTAIIITCLLIGSTIGFIIGWIVSKKFKGSVKDFIQHFEPCEH